MSSRVWFCLIPLSTEMFCCCSSQHRLAFSYLYMHFLLIETHMFARGQTQSTMPIYNAPPPLPSEELQAWMKTHTHTHSLSRLPTWQHFSARGILWRSSLLDNLKPLRQGHWTSGELQLENCLPPPVFCHLLFPSVSATPTVALNNLVWGWKLSTHRCTSSSP